MRILVLLKAEFSMKKLMPLILLSFLFFLLSACNDMKQIDPEKHFAGPQLVLAKAIQAADRGSVLRLVKETDLNTPGSDDLTLLFFAINESIYNDNPPERLEIVSDLVREGADPLQPQRNMPGSPAEIAAKGDKDIWLKALLDGGLDPNARDKPYHVPLIFTTLESKNTATLALMLERGVDINTRNSLGETPLVDAFFKGDFDKVFFLLDHGADPNPVNKQGRSFRQMVNRKIQQVKEDSDYYNNLKKLDAKMHSLGG